MFPGGIGDGLARSEHPNPRPGSDAATIRRPFGQANRAPRGSAAGQLVFAAAWLIPIGRFPEPIVCAIAGAWRGGAR